MRRCALFLSALVVACSPADPADPADPTPQPAPLDDDAGRPDAGEPEPDPPLGPDPVPDAGSSPDPTTPGCGLVPPADALWSVEHDGRTRTFRVHLPASYDEDAPTPVVLSFHGRAVTADSQETTSRFSDRADDEGFIVVYPEGDPVDLTWNAGVCCGQAQLSAADDVGFTGALLDELERALCIDTDRVYANGFSNGAFLTYRLACEMSDRLAAVGGVAGVTGVVPCEPSRAVPVLHLHGTADTVVPYAGNLVGIASVDAHIEGWVERNACTAGPEVTFDEADVRCERWTGCDDDVEVELCTVAGGGHQWPGGVALPFLGFKSDTVDATARLWDFYASYAR